MKAVPETGRALPRLIHEGSAVVICESRFGTAVQAVRFLACRIRLAARCVVRGGVGKARQKTAGRETHLSGGRRITSAKYG